MTELKRYVVTRQLPGVDKLTEEQLRDAAQQSNKAIGQLGGDVVWENSFVLEDKTYCIYKAKDEVAIKRHAELSGFPASEIEEIKGTLAPHMGE